MKITRKTRISYVAEKKTSITPQKENTNVGFCHLCEAEMIPAQIAGEYFNVSSRTIYRLIEADKIHFVEAEDHKIFICPVSFKKSGLRKCGVKPLKFDIETLQGKRPRREEG